MVNGRRTTINKITEEKRYEPFLWLTDKLVVDDTK